MMSDCIDEISLEPWNISAADFWKDLLRDIAKLEDEMGELRFLIESRDKETFPSPQILPETWNRNHS